MIKVLVVDDHQIFRDGLRMLIDSTDGIEIVGEAGAAEKAMELIGQLEPDLVLMDIQMPEENGIDLTYRVKEAYPAVHVLMLTMFEDDQSVFSALQAGACGYILKGINREEMLSSIRIAGEGGAIFSPRIAGRVMAYFSGLAKATGPAKGQIDKSNLPMLSQREYDVLELLTDGADNQTIARKLTLTPKTVRNYVSQVLKKLEVESRDEAVIRNRLAGLT